MFLTRQPEGASSPIQPVFCQQEKCSLPQSRRQPYLSQRTVHYLSHWPWHVPGLACFLSPAWPLSLVSSFTLAEPPAWTLSCLILGPFCQLSPYRAAGVAVVVVVPPVWPLSCRTWSSWSCHTAKLVLAMRPFPFLANGLFNPCHIPILVPITWSSHHFIPYQHSCLTFVSITYGLRNVSRDFCL